MAYRGEDLDLRVSGRSTRDSTSSEFALNGTRPRAPLSSGRADPVVIDDTVMACCNHAYDIAQAHGASEVRLEHLVHALTRVEAAADILESRGIREAHLRRESASVIAAEIPVGLAHSQSAPRASAEFEDVLRRAAQQAASQGASRGASVHDLLWVLLNYNRDIPAIALLLRHAAGWQSWDWPNRSAGRDEPRRRETPRTVERVVERIVERPVDRRPAPSRQTPSYIDPPQDRSIAQQSAAFNPDGLYARLDAMEQSMRSLQADIAADRRTFTDLVRDLQRDLADNRSMPASAADLGPMIDHLRAVEANVEDRLGDLARTATTLTDRLHKIETSVSHSAQEGARNWNILGDRLKSIDNVVANSSSTGLADIVTDQLVTVAEQSRQATSRIDVLERNISDRLRTIEQQTAAQNNSGVQTLINDRFQAVKGHLDQSRLDLTSAMAQVIEPLVNRVQQLEAKSERGLTDSGQMLQTVVSRINTFDTSLKSQNDSAKADFVEMHEALFKLGSNQQTLAGNLDQWRMDSVGDLGIISNRLELLERGSALPVEQLKQLQADMVALQQVALADYDHNRRGFKNWLFGTDEVFAGSWRDETSALRTRLRQLKEPKKA